MRTSPISLLLTVGCTLAAGCTDVPSDPKDDSFGGSGAKEDGQYSACQLAEVLKLVNDSSSTASGLEDKVGLASNAASAIAKHRNGPDGQQGTGDDDIFDDLNELDAVDYVGNLALGKLVYAVIPKCENDLNDRPFIDDQTFTGPATGWARDNEEVEVVLGIKGTTGQKLRDLLLQKNSTGRTLYDRIRKAHIMESFTYGYSLDEMPWDSDSQAAREQMPYVSLTIEPDRYAPAADTGEMEISLGTDLMDDTYYDTHAYTLLGNDIELRARARWDDPTTVRRILIASKFGTEIDADGNKTNAKVDIRNDNGTSFIPKLDDDVRRGKTAWNGSDQAATPIRGVYEQLKMKNLLLDVGAHHGVLLLEPAVHLRSTRSRYHMNEANITNVKAVYTNAVTRINAALAMVTKAKTAGIIPSSQLAAVNAMETLGKGIVDKSLIAQRLGTTVTNLKTPDNWTQPTDAAGLAANKKTAEAINALYHEFATALDDTDRAITNAADENFDAFTDMFRAWRISIDKTFARKRAWDPFVNSYRQLDAATSLAAFNTYGAAQKAAGNDVFDDFVALDAAGWTKLGNYLDKMALTTGERMIETAGIAAQQMWFDQARMLWVPSSSRAFSNFMIDTTDMVDMLTMEEWNSIPEAQRTFAQPLPAAKIFNTVFVNELQIELGMEKAYVDRIKALEAQLAMTPNDANVKAQLDGAKFVFAQYTGAMKVLTELKGENVLDRLKKAGAPSGITWVAPADSKGNLALKILADRD
ncbi:MAG TPA: hypothetical protein VL326_02100 [Kofleriaceae bacterium]|nr:hypothetical protein [Kofleriaceae bacterium]